MPLISRFWSELDLGAVRSPEPESCPHVQSVHLPCELESSCSCTPGAILSCHCQQTPSHSLFFSHCVSSPQLPQRSGRSQSSSSDLAPSTHHPLPRPSLPRPLLAAGKPLLGHQRALREACAGACGIYSVPRQRKCWRRRRGGRWFALRPWRGMMRGLGTEWWDFRSLGALGYRKVERRVAGLWRKDPMHLRMPLRLRHGKPDRPHPACTHPPPLLPRPSPRLAARPTLSLSRPACSCHVTDRWSPALQRTGSHAGCRRCSSPPSAADSCVAGCSSPPAPDRGSPDGRDDRMWHRDFVPGGVAAPLHHLPRFHDCCSPTSAPATSASGFPLGTPASTLPPPCPHHPCRSCQASPQAPKSARQSHPRQELWSAHGGSWACAACTSPPPGPSRSGPCLRTSPRALGPVALVAGVGCILPPRAWRSASRCYLRCRACRPCASAECLSGGRRRRGRCASSAKEEAKEGGARRSRCRGWEACPMPSRTSAANRRARSWQGAMLRFPSNLAADVCEWNLVVQLWQDGHPSHQSFGCAIQR